MHGVSDGSLNSIFQHAVSLYIQFRNFFRVLSKLVFHVERVPDLGKKLIFLGADTIVPGLSFALVTPMSAFQNRSWASREVMSELTGKLERRTPKNAPYRSFYREVLPMLSGIPVSINMVFHIVLNKMDCTVFCLCQLGKVFLQYIANQLLPSGKLRDKAENGDNCTQALHVRIVKVLYGVLSKVQIILQFIGILVEMPVEISYSLLLWRKDIVRIWDSQFSKGFLVHFISTGSTAFSAADIIDMIPEALIKGSLYIV